MSERAEQTSVTLNVVEVFLSDNGEANNCNNEVAAGTIEHPDFIFDPVNKRVIFSDSSVRLQPQQSRVLEMLMRSPNKVIADDDIRQGVVNTQYVCRGWLRNYMAVLRRKLGDTYERRLIERVENGYRFNSPVL